MTIKELITELQAIENQDRLVIIQRDPEGNGYMPLTGVWATANYSPYSPSQGEAGIEKLTPELRSNGYSEEDVNDGTPAVVLQP